MNRILAVVLSFTFSSALCAQQINLSAVSLTDLKGTPSSASFPVPEPITPAGPTPEKEWTVMAFLNGKDSDGGLDTLAVQDLNRLAAIGSSEKINILAEVGIATFDLEHKASYSVKRYHLKRSAALGDLSNSTEYPLPLKVDMGDYKSVSDFIIWAQANFPAKRYIFIILGHGGGWMDPQSLTSKSVSPDSETHSRISLAQMKLMFTGTKGVDIYIGENCLMQMMEVAYELAPYVKIAIGSGEGLIENSSKNSQYNYEALVDKISQTSDISTEGAAAYFIDSTYPSYTLHEDLWLTLSALRLDKTAGLLQRLDTWADAVMRSGDAPAVRKAWKDCLRFSWIQFTHAPYGDLYHFIELVTENTTAPELKSLGSELMDYIKRQFVLKNAAAGYRAQHNTETGAYMESDMARNSHGISINLPPIDLTWQWSLQTSYADTGFGKAGKWPVFCDWIRNITSQPPATR